jgi:RimJ/RimL family protein N-acetyltransferase
MVLGDNMRLQINNALALITFDKNKHIEIHNELISGESKSDYIKDVSKRLLLGNGISKFSFNHSYLVEISNQIVGYVFLSGMIKNQIYLEYSVLKEYRKKGLGKYILETVTNYVFENFNNIKQINLDIDPSNEASMKTALSSGYDIDDDYDKNTINSSKTFICDNRYYIDKNKGHIR